MEDEVVICRNCERRLDTSQENNWAMASVNQSPGNMTLHQSVTRDY